jgi:threonine dehydrogenase-like Zn-dependent dehydrogenase
MTAVTRVRTMKAAIFYGEKDIRVEERPIPEPLPEEVLIRVRSAGICGSDLLGYNGIGSWQPPRGVGIEQGHELAGEIVELGSSVTGLSVGQRVAVQPEHLISCGSCRECSNGLPHLCRHLGLLHGTRQSSHGFSQYDTCVATNVWPIPDTVSFDSAALADCYGVAVHAIHRVGSVSGKLVAVIGCGTIGLSIGQTARALGSGRVVMIGDQANEARHLIVKTHESVAWCSVTRDGRGTVGAPLVWLPALPLTWGREVPLQVAAHESP